jgi:hypothetical protein
MLSQADLPRFGRTMASHSSEEGAWRAGNATTRALGPAFGSPLTDMRYGRGLAVQRMTSQASEDDDCRLACRFAEQIAPRFARAVNPITAEKGLFKGIEPRDANGWR